MEGLEKAAMKKIYEAEHDKAKYVGENWGK